ncbi:protein of unknown function [Moritella yayanosii]|uniref:Uncharacterized protein n=1 Tax=Moritella yayanosii TaxID=69539 RepID=A0A330LHY9_9GAMM|nr:protein of unknown function [Moritella yayanosii]
MVFHQTGTSSKFYPFLSNPKNIFASNVLNLVLMLWLTMHCLCR